MLGWGIRTDAGGGAAGVSAVPIGMAAGEDRPTRTGLAAHGNHSMEFRAKDDRGEHLRGGDAQPERARFGPYRLLRGLDGCAAADRLLALHEKKQTSHVVYRFGVMRDSAERRRFIAAVEPLASLEHAHLLPVEEYSFAADGRGWLVTPYTGSQIGLMSLERLLADKGGRMAPSEVERALTHTLEASAWAHGVGLVNGPITASQILIDRRGSATIELYGLARRLQPEKGGGDVAQARAAEVRSVVEIGYRLLTGMAPAGPHIQPSRLVKRLDRRWDAFFGAGLGDGFSRAGEALAGLPGGSGVAEPAARTVASRRGAIPMIRPSGTEQR
jgi:hypothetical protein